MQGTSTNKGKNVLDRPAFSVEQLDWTKVAFIVLILIAIVTRLWGLDWRAMSHDESLHVVYSHKLFSGLGYQHDPMMHGPFLFHANALAYFLFGVNDFTGRLVPAIFGVILVALPWFMRRWLGRLGALATSFMILISPSISYYSRYIRNEAYILVFGLALIILMFKYFESRNARLLYGMAALTALMFATKEVAYIFILTIGVFLAVVLAFDMARQSTLRPKTPVFDVVLLLGTLTLPLAAAFPVRLFGFSPLDYTSTGIMRSGAVFLALLGISTGLGLWWNRKVWPIAVGIYYAIFVLLQTTFFTNGKGFATGIMGSLGYWLDQQAVQRGSQPWYYYGVVMPIYEFLPILFGIVAVVLFVVARVRNGEDDEGESPDARRAARLFMPFMIYFTIATMAAYTIAGEKMPWLMVHPALPLIVLAGWGVNRVLAGVDFRSIWKKGAPILALSLGLLIFAIARLLTIRPFQGREIEQLSETMGWLAALLVGAGLVALVVTYVQKLGGRSTWHTSFAALFVFLSLFTTRAMWMANYINYDYATEYLVYAHATPDIKLVVNDLETLSRRLYGDKSITFAYDDDSTWPLEWYFLQFPNAKYYGAQPNKEVLDVPVVIAGDKNWDKVKPFLGNRYYRFTYKLIWWPVEGYKEWKDQNVFTLLKDPANREKLWNILYYREYTHSPAEWPLRHEFAMFVRKDIANQVWDFGATPPEAFELPADIYLEGMRTVNSVATIGSMGAGPGQLSNPRNVAVGPDGNVYVLDTNNHRVQVFDANGQFLRMWGSEGAGAGQLQEPWGIAVGPNGFVYVADTWNHRVVKFTAEGDLAGFWGYYASTDGSLGEEGTFWGPRALAVDAEGNVYVTDTGNKRIEKFSPEGDFLGQWGGYGVEPGQLDEPVGIAIDRDGNIYVADTWNHRVQKFNSDFVFLTAWDILSWEGQSTINKPYLTVGSDNRVYISDPEGYRVLVYDVNGQFVATFGVFGSDAGSFNIPTGLAASEDGFIYVADSGNNRIMKFQTLP
jgi:uncharacterized protein (TIGR03663 family)